jgi:hypothetical protein
MSFQRLATRITALALGACLASPNTLQAQEPGAKVRVTTTARPSTWVAGLVALKTPDSLAIITQEADPPARDTRMAFHAGAPTIGAAGQATQPDTLWLARSEVQRLEVSQGRKSNAGKGALIGGSVVGGLGLLGGIAFCSDEFWECNGWEVPAAAAIGFVMGVLPGAAIGSLSHRERWEAIRIRPVVASGGLKGVRLSLAMAF